MILNYLEYYLENLRDLEKNTKKKFFNIDEYILERKIPYREKVKEIFFNYMSLNPSIENIMFKRIEKHFINEIVGIKEEEFEISSKFYRELDSFFSKNKKTLNYYSNAYELLFLFTLNRDLGDILDDDLNILARELNSKNGDFVLYDWEIIRVVELLLKDEKSQFLGVYIIKCFLEGLEKRSKKRMDQIEGFFKKMDKRFICFNSIFDEMLINYAEINSRDILKVYKIFRKYVVVNKIMMRDFKMIKVR